MNSQDICFCIPHFNNSALTRRCLLSISELGGRAEVVIVDDHSRDEEYSALLEVVAEFGALNIRVFRNFRNRGVTYSKNRCFKLALSKWCVFIDCDDYFDVDEGRKMLEFLYEYEGHIVLFHCLNEEASKVDKDSLLSISEYASNGTGGEALTAVNKQIIKKPPYYGMLRGYEGLGLIRLQKLYSCDIYLSSIRPRIYTNDSTIRLSVGKGFRSRAKNIALGHSVLIRRYNRFLTFKRMLKLSLLVLFYNLYARLYK